MIMRVWLFFFFGVSTIQCTLQERNNSFTQQQDSIQIKLLEEHKESAENLTEKSWDFQDPYDGYSNSQVLRIYQKQLKPEAIRLRKSSVPVDTAFYLALKQLWPAWYGTTWDFNGYSFKPREGEIACGYFVSTTLRDAGMKLNRYDLAKLYSHAICNNVCEEVQEYNKLDDVISYIQSEPTDIYIVGLDSHVGFLIKEKNDVFFVHSNYIGEGKVTKEAANNSEALKGSTRYILGSILRNKAILNKWRNGEQIMFLKE